MITTDGVLAANPAAKHAAMQTPRAVLQATKAAEIPSPSGNVKPAAA